MKLITTSILIFLTMFAKAQDFQTLRELKNNETIPTGQCVIYGNFIQRLGFSSGGLAQDIRLINIDTKEIYSFRVKPLLKSAKENTFCYILKPGKYAIYNYWWGQSKWYGVKIFNEPIFKNIDASDSLAFKVNSGKIKKEDLEQFSFTITENSLNYMGTWHFDKGLVSFSDDKKTLDIKIGEKYKNIDLTNAKTVIPN